MNQKSIIAVLSIVVVIIISATVYFVSINKTSQPVPIPATKQSVTNQPSSTQLAQIPDETVHWKIFTSKQEGFTLKYPTNWTLEDGDKIDCGVTGGGCPDRVTFTAPDGLEIRYVKNDITSDNDDKFACGPGSGGPCGENNVLSLETISIQNFGQVYLLKQDGAVFLHMPLSQETIPVVGENKHTNFEIDFSLPSKMGGRYVLFVTASTGIDGASKYSELTADQFYNLESVKQAIMILKSLKY